MREGILSTGSWGLSSSPLYPKCLAQELLGTRVSGAETQLHSIYQPVCPEEGVPAPGGSPQGMAFLIHMKASYTGEVALVWRLLLTDLNSLVGQPGPKSWFSLFLLLNFITGPGLGSNLYQDAYQPALLFQRRTLHLGQRRGFRGPEHQKVIGFPHSIYRNKSSIESKKMYKVDQY